ncbi:MAG: FAD/NAD(P)-binding oxidoreductase [Thermoprotei archaeon]
MKNILVAGGGIGGTIVANRIAQKLSEEINRGEVSVSVLDRSEHHYYQPGFLLVSMGVMEPKETSLPEREVLDPKIKLSTGDKGTITKISVGDRQLTTADGKTHKYDILVLATGSHIQMDEIPGFAQGAETFFSLDGAKKMLKAVQSFTGGDIVVDVALLPHKCPVAPLEITLMLDDYFRKKGIRDKVNIHYCYPIQGVFGIPNVNKMMLGLFESRGINIHSQFTLANVDAANKKIVSKEGQELRYDLLVGVPPHKGAQVIGDSGLGDRRNWVPTDKYTLRLKDHDDVYVLGDTTDIPISKAGSTADYESYTVAHNVAVDVKGEGSKKTYPGSVFCYIATGMDQATYIKFDYSNPPNPPTPSQVHWWGKLAYNKLYWSIHARTLI